MMVCSSKKTYKFKLNDIIVRKDAPALFRYRVTGYYTFYPNSEVYTVNSVDGDIMLDKEIVEFNYELDVIAMRKQKLQKLNEI